MVFLVIKILFYFKEINVVLLIFKELLIENEDLRKFFKEMVRFYDLVYDYDKVIDLCYYLF